MIKLLLILYVSFISFISFSQELRVSTNNGYATGEMKAFKKIMLSTSGNIGTEFYIKYDLCFNTSAGISLLRFEYTDTANNSVFNSKYFFDFLFSIKKYYPVSRRSWVYWDFGVIPSYQISDKKEIRDNSATYITKRKNLGFNLGIFTNFGFKTIFTNKLSFDIGLSAQTDFLSSYKNESDKIKTDKRMLLMSFYWKLKQ